MHNFKFKMYNNLLTDTEFKQLNKRNKRIVKRNYALIQVPKPLTDTTAYCYNRKQLGNI